MSEKSLTTLDRETAKKLNPFVGDSPSETLELCIHATQELGCLPVAWEFAGFELDGSCLSKFNDVVAAALKFEQELMKQAEVPRTLKGGEA